MTQPLELLPPLERDDERSLIIRPVGTAAELVDAIKQYEEIKAAIVLQRDTQRIGDRTHIKKSGWLRIARAFGLTVEPVSEHFTRANTKTLEEGDDWGYEIVVRAVAPNGASMQGDGACWASEKQQKQRTRHNVRAHAYTRAMNRAISNLVGGGEVSAEELSGDYVDADPAPAPAPLRPAPKPAPAKQRKWASLTARAKAAGIFETMEQWEAFVKRTVGFALDSADPKHYDLVEDAIADKEQENRDLSALELPAVKP